MSLPILRRPKSNGPEVNSKLNIRKPDVQLIILTLRNGVKLVVPSDSLHGIIMSDNMYKCLFCDIEINSNELKEAHKTLNNHRTLLESHPFMEELNENLIRQMTESTCYCTICNAVTSNYIIRHIKTEEHLNELNKAILRSNTYKPLDINNNK